jgi:uncharacterized protein YprB with RNaseH-like and TPR domain
VLKQTFAHLPKIGLKKERQLRAVGISDWSLLRENAADVLGPKLRDDVLEALDSGQAALDDRNSYYFYKTLPRELLWRMVPDFEDEIAYLDIETTGAYLPPRGHTTSITFYYQGRVYQEVDPEAKQDLVLDIAGSAKLLVTFFGEVFDVPFLRKEFGLPLEIAQLDLCFWLRRLGYRGGLKQIEKQFPDVFPRSRPLDGWDAVRLWQAHRRGMEGALETLLTYNAEDTVVLEGLLVHAFNMEVERNSDWAECPLALRPLPQLATRVDDTVYSWLRGSLGAAPPSL